MIWLCNSQSETLSYIIKHILKKHRKVTVTITNPVESEHPHCNNMQGSFHAWSEQRESHMNNVHHKRHPLVTFVFWIIIIRYFHEFYYYYFSLSGDAFLRHRGKNFTTKDRDNDSWLSGNCAVRFQGAWWYAACHSSNLNGLYLAGNHSTRSVGVNWLDWRGEHYSLKRTEMKLRPVI